MKCVAVWRNEGGQNKKMAIHCTTACRVVASCHGHLWFESNQPIITLNIIQLFALY